MALNRVWIPCKRISLGKEKVLKEFLLRQTVRQISFLASPVLKTVPSQNLQTPTWSSVRYLHELSADNVDIEVVADGTGGIPPTNYNTIRFGSLFSDHMLSIEWTADHGWHKPKIHPLRPIEMHPAAKVLHYAPELFEGMKAYRGAEDGAIRLFRPDLNMKRMNSSAVRACLPTFDGAELTKLIAKLVSVDAKWVPDSSVASLYIRPTMIATEASLGVGQTTSALLFVMTGPVGPYYPTGFKPVSLMADPAFVRAWPGGSGNTKMGSNYAPTLLVQKIAAEQYGCQQVLWLFGEDHQLTEVGTMNVFMYWVNEEGETELVTPPLESGVILPGVTRNTMLTLAREMGEFKVSTRTFTMGEVTRALKTGRVMEMFGCGTACVVAPIESILYQGEKLAIPTMHHENPLWNRLYTQLTDIQYGRVSREEWTYPVHPRARPQSHLGQTNNNNDQEFAAVKNFAA